MIRLNCFFQAKEGKFAEALEAAKALTAESLKQDGCVAYDVFESATRKDVFIISYNDFALNDVVLGGLTTISADFAEMGRLAAQMIITGKLEKVHCPFRMNRRHTF